MFIILFFFFFLIIINSHGKEFKRLFNSIYQNVYNISLTPLSLNINVIPFWIICYAHMRFIREILLKWPSEELQIKVYGILPIAHACLRTLQIKPLYTQTLLTKDKIEAMNWNRVFERKCFQILPMEIICVHGLFLWSLDTKWSRNLFSAFPLLSIRTTRLLWWKYKQKRHKLSLQ